MGKTRRSYPYDHSYFRNPRGSKAALQRGDRAVPPNAYDDLNYSPEHILPWKIAVKMRRRGCSDSKIAGCLAVKYRLTRRQILYILKHL